MAPASLSHTLHVKPVPPTPQPPTPTTTFPQMNLRSLCFARVSRDRGEPWLWWEYADRVGDACRMKDGLYTEACAQQAWARLGACVQGGGGFPADEPGSAPPRTVAPPCTKHNG